jgi:hypothetical protein
MVIAFLNDELHGRDWTPPLPFSVNSVTLALKALHKMPPPPAEVEASFPPVVEGWVSPNSVGNVARFLSSVLCETFWHRSELRYAFLPKRAVEKLVERTKAEVKQETNGEEWVSTGDVLLAWALKVRPFPSPFSPFLTISFAGCSFRRKYLFRLALSFRRSRSPTSPFPPYAYSPLQLPTQRCEQLLLLPLPSSPLRPRHHPSLSIGTCASPHAQRCTHCTVPPRRRPCGEGENERRKIPPPPEARLA